MRDLPQTYCNSKWWWGGQVKADVSKVTVLEFSLKCSGTQISLEPTKGGKKQVMFEIKAVIVYHPWHFSPAQTGQLLHTESNNEKNATLFFSSLNQESPCQHLQVLRDC